MGWLLTAHVRRYHQHYHSSGHVYQGRFRAFPIQEDDHLLTVLRYIERNPVRAGLVERAEDWRWSSAAPTRLARRSLTPGPFRGPSSWLEHVNAPQTDAELEALRECIRRRRPYGDRRGWRKPPTNWAWRPACGRAVGRERGRTDPPSLFDFRNGLSIIHAVPFSSPDVVLPSRRQSLPKRATTAVSSGEGLRRPERPGPLRTPCAARW